MFCGIIWFAADVETFTTGTRTASVAGLFDFGTAMADSAAVGIHIHVEMEDAWTVRLKALIDIGQMDKMVERVEAKLIDNRACWWSGQCGLGGGGDEGGEGGGGDWRWVLVAFLPQK